MRYLPREWPPFLHLAHSGHVLIHKTVDLGNGGVYLHLFTGEDGRDSISPETLASSRCCLDIAHASKCVEKIANGREVTALALLEIVSDSICSSRSICFEGQIVVSNLCTVLLHSDEDIVCHVLDALGDGGQQSTLLLCDVQHSCLLHGLDLSLCLSDSISDICVQISDHSVTNIPDGFAVCVGCLLPAHDNASVLGHLVFVVLLVRSDSIGECGHAGCENRLGIFESSRGGHLRSVFCEVLNLLGSQCLVFVHDLLDDTTSLFVLRVAVVALLHKRCHLLLHLDIDLVL